MFRQSLKSLGYLSRVSAARAVKLPATNTITRTSLLSNFKRHNSTNASTKPNNSAQIKTDTPQLMIAFTCKKCDTRSSHTMSKQAYTKGTVLITCPGCKNRHLIADHLKIFSDNHITIEDILKSKGESVSQNTEDLVFEEIPDKLKGMIGHLAKDAPKEKQVDSNKVHSLPHNSDN